MEPVEIIPYHAFEKKYYNVLFNLQKDYFITNTERLVLFELSKFSYKDGLCCPKQQTLAKRVKKSVRQLIRTLRSLEDKGFIKIKRPNLLKRHLQMEGNHYFFLDHESYSPYKTSKPKQEPNEKIIKVSSEKSEEMPVSTIKDYKYNKKTTSHPEKTDGAFLESEYCDQEKIKQIMQKCAGTSRFNIISFIRKNEKAYPAEAIKQTIDAVLDKMTSCFDDIIFNAFEWWGYAVQVLRRIGGNMNEQISIDESNRWKKETLCLKI